MKLRQRIQAYSASHAFSINKKLDNHLSENLPDLMDEYKLADKGDLVDLDKDFSNHESRMEKLQIWKDGFEKRINKGEERINRLKKKYGMEGGS
jgi:predicted  nucleic acid-binding Zn-ribbon protein